MLVYTNILQNGIQMDTIMIWKPFLMLISGIITIEYVATCCNFLNIWRNNIKMFTDWQLFASY